jgi:hypothetical protein
MTAIERAKSAVARGGDRVAALDQRPVAHRLFLRALPRAILARFDPATARDLEAVFELRVREPGGEPARFALLIAGGSCQVIPGPADDAGAVATVGADDLIRLVSGAAGWPELLSKGRLAMTGDPFLALRFPSLFRLPLEGSAA